MEFSSFFVIKSRPLVRRWGATVWLWASKLSLRRSQTPVHRFKK